MNNSQFSLANRKQLADTLRDTPTGLRQRVKQQYDERREKLEKKLFDAVAEKEGALKLYEDIVARKRQIEELESELAILGFHIDYSDDLDFNSHGESLCRKQLNDALDKELGPRDFIDARFDSAQLAMMTVASLEDAKKILESVSALCE